VIPYNSFQGCIIKASQKRFFPAQIRGSQRGGSDALPRREIMLSDVLIACIFQDHSLITIEKGLPYQPSRLKEYAINYESTYALDKIGIGICVLKTGRKKTSRMRIVRSGENLILVICNLNGMVEIIKLVPE
jgi:hypothetical protein